MSQLPATRRTASLTGSARLSLSVGTKQAPARTPSNTAGRHPLRQDWSLSYVHRPPGTKVDYEKEIRKVATFGSIESFLHLYAHITSPSDMAPVTDLLCFASRIQRPGIWEEMVNGGKFTIRLLHPVTPVLYESLLFSLIGDQFDESDNVVGCVLSVRQTEDIMSVWVEEEGEAVRSGALREKILTLLGLPPTTLCEYRSNKALLDAASSLKDKLAEGQSGAQQEGGFQHGNQNYQHGNQGGSGYRHHERGYGRSHESRDSEQQDGDRRSQSMGGQRRAVGNSALWGNGFRSREQQPAQQL